MPVMLTQKEIDNLSKLYLAARERLLDTIINYRGVGTKVYANTILKQLEKELESLQKVSNTFVETAVPVEYTAALNEIYDYFQSNQLLMKPPAAFAQLHNDAVYTVAREMQYQIQEGIAQAGRQVLRYVESSRDEVLRAAGLAATGEKIASGSTVKQMRQNLIGKLQNQGFMTVQYGSGPNAYQVSLDTYASMVARSTTREAGNLARENQLTANGYDLMKMSSHYPTCPLCAQFQGRVYSISGKDKRFPPLSRAFQSGYKNIHPNCRHSVHPYIEGLQAPEEVQADVEQSNKPFIDSRDQNQIDLYNQQQGKNRQARQDLYQYERYKSRLGEDAPKSLMAFRRVKNAGGEKWSNIQTDYKRRSRLINNPDFALPNAESASIDEPKFTKYFFGGSNLDGLSKGVAFSSHLGYNIDNWKDFEKEILEKSKLNPAIFDRETKHGKYYNQRMVVYGPNKNPMDIMVPWEVKDGKARLVTAFPNKEVIINANK